MKRPDRLGAAELRGHDGDGGRDGTRRVGVEEVGPVAGGVRFATEVDDGLGAGDEFAGPVAEDADALHDRVGERRHGVHAPGRIAARAFIVPDAASAAGGEVLPCLLHGVVVAVVDG